MWIAMLQPRRTKKKGKSYPAFKVVQNSILFNRIFCLAFFIRVLLLHTPMCIHRLSDVNNIH